MEEKYYKCYNAESVVEFNPVERMKNHVKRTDSIITHLKEIRKEILTNYIEAFCKRLMNEVNDYNVDSNTMITEIKNELKYLKTNEKLTKLVIRFMAKKMDITDGSKIESKEAKFKILNWTKAFEGLSYFRVKSFTDILGKEKGIELYTELLRLYVKELNENKKINEKHTVKSRNDGAVKYWCKEGIADFTFTFIDDNQVLYRFDKCVTHEALKDYNDPDVAYIASCYMGDIKEWNEGDIIHLSRTQTLHHGDFCDELYYDTRLHKKPPKQPTLEFTRSIGKKK
ncbi:MAG: hypothetical protein FK730_14735 [Asgard group archaeon]|nr:hypothetical protein [Asgard group archaeon]